ncbi:MAG: class I SAM-dependent methyltransferase [Burkholderiales bacterium]|nr:class I SAM-dependent methyltransferase [Burkholderiales bacterium]
MADPTKEEHWSVHVRDDASEFVRRLIDLSVEANLVPDRDFHYKWDEYADWQLDVLKQSGLQPKHRLLDVGCGPLRLGLKAIPYLEDGGYFGMDAYAPYIDLGAKLIVECGIEKRFTVLCSSTFEFERFGSLFDYAMAQSVFTHMSAGQIRECVRKLKPVMRPGATFLFTYFFTPHQRGIMYYGVQPMIAPRVLDTALFEEIARNESITFEASPLPHPAQRVGIFRF